MATGSGFATRVPVSQEKPHGIDSSLALHGPDGERMIGFDNAHALGQQTRGETQDHRHLPARSWNFASPKAGRLRSVQPLSPGTLKDEIWTIPAAR